MFASDFFLRNNPEHKLGIISNCGFHEWMVIVSLASLVAWFFFLHVLSRSFVQGGCRNARRCAVAFCLRLRCVYMFQVDHPYESLYKMGGGRVQTKINKWNKWGWANRVFVDLPFSLFILADYVMSQHPFCGDDAGLHVRFWARPKNRPRCVNPSVLTKLCVGFVF